MAELLTHALAGFVIGLVLSWKIRWITPPYVAAVMVGAILPDLNRMELLIPASVIEGMLGIPWTWLVFHRLGGALLVILLLSLFVAQEHRKPVFILLVLGATSHFALDYLLWQAPGTTSMMLWPLLDLEVPFGGFYRSTDRWPALVAIICTGVVIVIERGGISKDG